MTRNYKPRLTKEMFTAKEMTDELLRKWFKWGFAERELVFITYIDCFVYITYKNIGKSRISKKEFLNYIKNVGDNKQRKLANEIYKRLKNKKEVNLLKIESLLFWYGENLNMRAKNTQKARNMNKAKHKEEDIFKNFILDLYNQKRGKITEFYEKNEQEIQEFIQKNCPKLNKKIEKNIDYDLQNKIQTLIYRENSIIKFVTDVP